VVVSSGWWVVVRVRCPRCGHEWEYRGRALYATCPRCYRKVNIEKHRVEEDHGDRVTAHATDLSGAWMTVVKASDYEKMAPAVKRCTELVGGEWKEGEGGMDVYVPDEKAGEWIECLKKEGIELVRVESMRH